MTDACESGVELFTQRIDRAIFDTFSIERFNLEGDLTLTRDASGELQITGGRWLSGEENRLLGEIIAE